MNQVESYLNENYLCHYGVLGMKWGVRRFQPYPKGSKGGKEVGKAPKVKQRDGNVKNNKNKQNGKVLRSGSIKKKSSNPIKRYKESKKQKEIQKAKEAEQQRKQEVERVLKTGSATEVLKYKNEYSTKQLQDAAERIKWTSTLSKYSKNELNPGLAKIDSYMKQVKTVNEWVTTGVNAKKNIDSIIEMFDEASKRQNRNRNGNRS